MVGLSLNREPSNGPLDVKCTFTNDASNLEALVGPQVPGPKRAGAGPGGNSWATQVRLAPAKLRTRRWRQRPAPWKRSTRWARGWVMTRRRGFGVGREISGWEVPSGWV